MADSGADSEAGKIHCYNKGCGQKFNPSENHNEACLYHAGQPYFHDAYKIWNCCGKKSTDFSTWLSYPGCTKGPHNGEKPVEEVANTKSNEAKKQIRPEKADEVIVWNGLNKPAPRPFSSEENGRGREAVKLRIETSEAALNAIQQQKQNLAEKLQNTHVGDELVGAVCKNNSCRAIYHSPEANDSECLFHPGTAIFHEGMKFWSCCEKKTSDFSSFLDQVGCTTGQHVWGKNEKVDNVREDWFARGGSIHVNFYCKGALPEASHFESDGLMLRGRIVHGYGDKETPINIDLWGEIAVAHSKVILGERKVEVVLKQASAEGWPKLRYEQNSKPQ